MIEIEFLHGFFGLFPLKCTSRIITLCCFGFIKNKNTYKHTHKHTTIIEKEKKNQNKRNKLFTARFTGLWRNYQMPETISKSAYQRLRGAYMGYNSFDDAMEHWPDARWGNKQIHNHFFSTSFH